MLYFMLLWNTFENDNKHLDAFCERPAGNTDLMSVTSAVRLESVQQTNNKHLCSRLRIRNHFQRCSVPSQPLRTTQDSHYIKRTEHHHSNDDIIRWRQCSFSSTVCCHSPTDSVKRRRSAACWGNTTSDTLNLGSWLQEAMLSPNMDNVFPLYQIVVTVVLGHFISLLFVGHDATTELLRRQLLTFNLCDVIKSSFRFNLSNADSAKIWANKTKNIGHVAFTFDTIERLRPKVSVRRCLTSAGGPASAASSGTGTPSEPPAHKTETLSDASGTINNTQNSKVFSHVACSLTSCLKWGWAMINHHMDNFTSQ